MRFSGRVIYQHTGYEVFMERKNGKRYTEVSRKSRVKMHKSGKHWVRTVMSQIGFIHLGKH
ncbi:KxYKxGKxW signal peptide domain-containing protein, partial [Streptococcus suis]|nr:KxYKxGKxW signal peptide domain-containing protein [Streptococcus suis]